MLDEYKLMYLGFEEDDARELYKCYTTKKFPKECYGLKYTYTDIQDILHCDELRNSGYSKRFSIQTKYITETCKISNTLYPTNSDSVQIYSDELATKFLKLNPNLQIANNIEITDYEMLARSKKDLELLNIMKAIRNYYIMEKVDGGHVLLNRIDNLNHLTDFIIALQKLEVSPIIDIIISKVRKEEIISKKLLSYITSLLNKKFGDNPLYKQFNGLLNCYSEKEPLVKLEPCLQFYIQIDYLNRRLDRLITEYTNGEFGNSGFILGIVEDKLKIDLKKYSEFYFELKDLYDALFSQKCNSDIFEQFYAFKERIEKKLKVLFNQKEKPYPSTQDIKYITDNALLKLNLNLYKFKDKYIIIYLDENNKMYISDILNKEELMKHNYFTEVSFNKALSNAQVVSVNMDTEDKCELFRDEYNDVVNRIYLNKDELILDTGYVYMPF